MLGKMDCAGATHVGQVRSSNEDQFLIADLNRSMRVFQTSLGLSHHTRLFGNSQGKLLLVADGMGGHESGERASQLAIDGVVNYVLNTLHWMCSVDESEEEEFTEDLKSVLQHCQQTLIGDAGLSPQRQGMGTTLTMAYIAWPQLYVAHAGDSRCYLFHDGTLQQLTRDHTLAQLYQETQQADPLAEAKDELRLSHLRHQLWNAIQANNRDDVHAEVNRTQLQLGDSVLLCTDGLYEHVSNDRIAELLKSKRSAAAICERLIAEANEAGGSDNITVVVSRFRTNDEEDLLEEEATAEMPVAAAASGDDDTDPHIVVETGLAN